MQLKVDLRQYKRGFLEGSSWRGDYIITMYIALQLHIENNTDLSTTSQQKQSCHSSIWSEANSGSRNDIRAKENNFFLPCMVTCMHCSYTIILCIVLRVVGSFAFFFYLNIPPLDDTAESRMKICKRCGQVNIDNPAV